MTTHTMKIRTIATITAAGALVLAVGACGAPGEPSAGAAAPTPVVAPVANPQPAPAPLAPAAPGPSVAAPAPVIDPRAEIDVDDQRGDGTAVAVRQARISQGTGHVAIFDQNRQLLGSAPVSAPGGQLNVVLTTPAVGSSELIAVLYGDNGDATFDAAADPRIVDEDNERESEDFDYRVG